MRRAIVVAASPRARMLATYSASRSGVARAGEACRKAVTSARSRRYASTVFGASRVAERARKESTALSVMGVVVDAAQPLGIDVRVHLRRRERAVAEQLLDRPQVCSSLEQVRRECVPQ